MPKWTQTPPRRPGVYWQWSGERGDKPRPLVVERNQWSPSLYAWIDDGSDIGFVVVRVIGGWWMPAKVPTTPKVERKAAK